MDKGFTVLEALVALTILSIGLATVYESFSGNLVQFETAGKEARRTLLADSLIERVGLDVPLEPGAHTGEQDGLAWKLEISKRATEDESDYVALDIVASAGEGDRLTRIETVRIAPRSDAQ